MACLKLEVDDVDEQMFDLDPTVTVKTEEQKDIEELSVQNEVDSGNNLKSDCGYGNVITIAPLGNMPAKDESVGPKIEYNELISVDTTEHDVSSQLKFAHDTDTQPMEPVEKTACVQQRSPNTPNSSSTTEAESMQGTSRSQPFTSYQGTGTSSPVTVSSVHTGNKQYPCEGFKMSNLLRQLTSSLTQTVAKPHKCPICGKGFVSLRDFKRHSLTHTGEKPYKCESCGKRFTENRRLKEHSLMHTGEKPHKCQICGKGFARSTDLKKHLLSQTGEEPHKCQICGKWFPRSSDLKTHLSTHTGEKPHKPH